LDPGGKRGGGISLLVAVVSGGCLGAFDDVPAFPDFMILFFFGGIGGFKLGFGNINTSGSSPRKRDEQING